jgi:hypothetical protein
MSNESTELSRSTNESPKNTASIKIIHNWLTLLSVYYKADLTETEIEIYIHGLKRYPAEVLDEAFKRCRDECKFMPKIADIAERLPEERKPYYDPPEVVFIPVKDWYEPYSKTAKLHVWENAEGYKRVAIVKLRATP